MNEIKYIDPYGPEAEAMKDRALKFYAERVASEDNGFVGFMGDEADQSVAGIKQQFRDAALMRAFPPNPSGIHPTEFKCLVLPKPVETVSKGGIIIPASKTEADEFATTEGTLIAASPLAFTYANETEWAGNKPVPGDHIIYGRYEGVQVMGKDGAKYMLINDKAIFAKAEF